MIQSELVAIKVSPLLIGVGIVTIIGLLIYIKKEISNNFNENHQMYKRVK